MANGAISDEQLDASSEWDAYFPVTHGRLYFTLAAGYGAWAAGTNDVNQWIQIDLGSQNTKVTRVATQGRPDYPQWVAKYNLQYGYDGVNFQYYSEQGQTIKKVELDFPICRTTFTLRNHFIRTYWIFLLEAFL